MLSKAFTGGRITMARDVSRFIQPVQLRRTKQVLTAEGVIA